ncbi:uncharacterized protein LOC141853349 isoform X2 [Brevipalpus obovatus]|uniref:uncharacterized protein LOC141853349 isoform X2 n=1 Tax=Brevipalpus obovatus TaxID=246614 RepID=UPI003D9DC0D1
MATANQQPSNCSVFWDIENVGVPKSMRPREFVEIIRKSVLAPNNLVVDEFFCVCDTVKIGLKSTEFLESLNRAGVTTVHISSTSKNAADEKIIDLMCKYVDKGGGSVVLIAGDVNYVNHLRRFQAKGVRNYLICSTLQSASKDLINSAHKSWILDRRGNEAKLKPFAASDSHVLKATTTRNGPCFVKVYGFPQHLDKRPLNQFKQLLSAGGGKIRTDINDGGFVWLAFRCSEDARRTAIKLNGWRFGDRLLQAQYVENPPFQFNYNYNQGYKRDYDLPSASSYERRGMSSGVRDGIQNLSIHKTGDELGASSRNINVEICFQNYDREAMEHFVRKMLPGFNGSFIRSDASRFLVDFNSERDANKFMVEINSLAGGSTKAAVRAKIIPTSSRQDSSSGDDDVVYVCTKEGAARSSSPRKEEHNRLYLSIEYKRRPDQALVDQLSRNGIKLLHEADKCMWFRVGEPMKGQKVMEKLNEHGFISILTERLPEDVKNWRENRF